MPKPFLFVNVTSSLYLEQCMAARLLAWPGWNKHLQKMKYVFFGLTGTLSWHGLHPIVLA